MSLPSQWSAVAPGVFRSQTPVVAMGSPEVLFLRSQAEDSALQRSRLCAHLSDDAVVQEMIITLQPGAYVQPHCHAAKPESYHVIAGDLDVVLFTTSGQVAEVISLAPYGSGKSFFLRLENSVFHTVIVRSGPVVMHETTSGPFRREDTMFAPWAPPATAEPGILAAYRAELAATVVRWQNTQS